MDKIIKMSLNKYRVFAVRHAQSRFNRDFPPHLNLTDPSLPKYGPEHFSRAVDPRYVDTLLTEEGEQQCLKNAETVNQMRDVEIVYISPLRRTLQTAHLLFGTHPDRERIRFVVDPNLRENLCCVGDLPQSSFKNTFEELGKHFTNLDTDTLMGNVHNHWYIHNLNDPLRETLLKIPEDDVHTHILRHI